MEGRIFFCVCVYVRMRVCDSKNGLEFSQYKTYSTTTNPFLPVYKVSNVPWYLMLGGSTQLLRLMACRCDYNKQRAVSTLCPPCWLQLVLGGVGCSCFCLDCPMTLAQQLREPLSGYHTISPFALHVCLVHLDWHSCSASFTGFCLSPFLNFWVLGAEEGTNPLV